MSHLLIDVAQVGLACDGSRILQDISFQMSSGDFLCVVGPNGSGKTTLIRCICRVIDSWVGSIRVAGKDIKACSHKELARQISYVPQIHGEVFPLTVTEFVAMGRYPYHTALSPLNDRDKAIIKRAIESVGIQHLIDRRIDSLSGGEKQKTYIAAALVQDTGILILDEPATYLDIKHQAELIALLKKLHVEGGYTIICVTHDINTAINMGNRILGLKNGEMMFCEHTSEISDVSLFENLFGVEFRFMEHSSTEVPIFLPNRSRYEQV